MTYIRWSKFGGGDGRIQCTRQKKKIPVQEVSGSRGTDDHVALEKYNNTAFV